MKRWCGLIGACAGLTLACTSAQRDAATRSEATVESVYTPLSGPTCTDIVDASDPNQSSYQRCDGVAGYSLLVRLVDAGRMSVDVVDSAGRAFPLHLNETVTSAMTTLREQAEWRVTMVNGDTVPIALLIGVEARENADAPERITRTWLAITQLAPERACVVESVVENARAASDVHTLADSARSLACKRRGPM